jgi:hypothetical protein
VYPLSLWLPCGLHGFAVPNTLTVTVRAGCKLCVKASTLSTAREHPVACGRCQRTVHKDGCCNDVNTTLALGPSYLRAVLSRDCSWGVNWIPLVRAPSVLACTENRHIQAEQIAAIATPDPSPDGVVVPGHVMSQKLCLETSG